MRFYRRILMSLAFVCAAAALHAAPLQQNYSDSWWNANESGWGITITDHDTDAFVQWYTYDSTGHNQKYVIAGGTFSGDKCQFSGTIQRVTGPSWTEPSFDPNLVVRTTAGSATIDFCPTGLAAGTIVFGYSADGVTGSKQLTRLSFGNDVPHWGARANTGAADFTDLWWNPSESGWGVSVTQHGNDVFFRIFVYDSDGRPLLFVVPGVTFNSPTSFTGALQTTTGPWFGSNPFDPDQVARTTAGTATLAFSDANNGVLGYTVNGVTKTKQITRMQFGASAASTSSFLMVFASNLQSASGGCTRDDASGCDLFSAKFDYQTRQISEVSRLTAYATASEMFPSISPDANWVAYDYGFNNTHEIRIIDLRTKRETTLLANARFPEWLDATHLLVSGNATGSKDVMLLELDLTGSSPALKTSTTICNRTSCAGTAQTSDAYPFPNGTRIAFQSLKSDRDVAAVSTINLDGSNFQLITGWDGSGHTIVNADGSELIYTVASSGAAQVFNLNSGIRTSLTLPATGAAMTAYDSRYASAVSANWVYAAWLKNDRSLLFSAQGGDASNVYKLSRIILAEFDTGWANPSLFDIASAIEQTAAKSGKDFCTVSARAVTSASGSSPPLLGILGAQQGDFTAIKTLGANTAQIPIPSSASAFSSMLAAAGGAGVQVMVGVDKSQIQTAALKFDLGKLDSLLTPLKDSLASSSIAGLLLAEDMCHVDPATGIRKWDITSAELSEAILKVKSIVPGLRVVINFSKSSCLDTFVSGAAAGSNIADVAVLNFFYYKWSTTPNLIASYNVSALNFKTFAPAAQVIPKIGVMQTVGSEASAFPAPAWIVDRSNEFLAYGTAFDGVLYYDFNQQIPTETKTISDVASDPAYVSALQTVFANAQSAYTR